MKWVDTFSTNMKKKVDKVLIQINKAKIPADKQRKCMHNHFTNKKRNKDIKQVIEDTRLFKMLIVTTDAYHFLSCQFRKKKIFFNFMANAGKVWWVLSSTILWTIT